MSKDIFVLVETKENQVRKVSFELLTMAKSVAEILASKTYAVVLGCDQAEVAQEVAGFADAVLVVDDEALKQYRNDLFAGALEDLIHKYRPFLVFGPATTTGRDLFPRVAARLNTGIVADAVGIEVTAESVKVKKPIFGGRVVSWVECRNAPTTIVTFRPNTFSIEKQASIGEIIKENVSLKSDPRITVVKTEKSKSRKVDLQEADFIICGGRGMKDAESFGALEEIATVMDGRVGASRAVVDSKWREYDDQVGKSGKTVSPKLYIGCGISGALHHIMGMDTSKVIVAINKDANAPIFHYADYGLVDDVFAVLPILKAELTRSKEER